MDKKGFTIVTLTTFAFFFGAGNLIFPPFAGLKTGASFGVAYFGYVFVDVGLSLLAIVAISMLGRASRLTVDFPKWISILFWLCLYIVIGPLFATPRTSVVAYEVGFLPFFHDHSPVLLLSFTTVFFIATLLFALYPTRVVKWVGGVLTPLLLIFLVILFIEIFRAKHFSPIEFVPFNESSAFGYGLLQGYLTMDTLAALIFGVLIINAIRSCNVTDSKEVAKYTVYTSIVAGVLLALVYLGLFYMGAVHPEFSGVASGGKLLTKFVHLHLGLLGQCILSVIIVLTCLTTSIGLIMACSEYFSLIYKRFSYTQWAVILCALSLCVSNVGLDRLIQFSIPVVVALYPVTILVILVTIMRRFFFIHKRVVIVSALVIMILSLLDAIDINKHVTWLAWLHQLPLFPYGVGWLVPSLITFVSVWLLSPKRPSHEKNK